MNITEINNILTDIPDSAIFYSVYGGKDYKITGASLKSAVKQSSEQTISLTNILTGTTRILSLGSASSITGCFIDFILTRGTTRRACGRIYISNNASGCSLTIVGLVTMPNTSEETGGASFSVSIDSGSIILSVIADSIDTDITAFSGKLKTI